MEAKRSECKSDLKLENVYFTSISAKQRYDRKYFETRSTEICMKIKLRSEQRSFNDESGKYLLASQV